MNGGDSMGVLLRSVRQGGWRPGPDPHSVEVFLRDLGFLPAVAGATATDAEIEEGLRRFQTAAGLEVDGVASRSTVHVLARARHALIDLRAVAA